MELRSENVQGADMYFLSRIRTKAKEKKKKPAATNATNDARTVTQVVMEVSVGRWEVGRVYLLNVVSCRCFCLVNSVVFADFEE